MNQQLELFPDDLKHTQAVSDFDNKTDLLQRRNDPINPAHYRTGKLQPWDVIEDWKLSFNLGNALKYINRAPHKGAHIQDLEKAARYLEREIELLKQQHDSK